MELRFAVGDEVGERDAYDRARLICLLIRAAMEQVYATACRLGRASEAVREEVAVGGLRGVSASRAYVPPF